MELVNRSLPKNHRIVLAGDLHYGNAAMHRKGWDEMKDRVEKERDLYLVLMGDQLESIATDDFRFDPEIHDGRMKPLIQADMMREELRPIKHKTIVIIEGNHEIKLSRFGPLTARMCADLGVEFGGYSCKLSVYDSSNKSRRDPMYKAFFTHGRFSINSSADDPLRRESNEKLSLKRRLAPLCSDAVLMGCGHSHKLIVAEPAHELYLYDNGEHIHSGYTHAIQNANFIHRDLRYYVNSGSFLKNSILGATTYSEFAGYRPIELGYAIAHVRGGVMEEVEKVYLGVDG